MRTTPVRWILGSASPRRREILEAVGLECDVRPSGMTEPAARPGEGPGSYAVRLARLKARDVGRDCGAGVVIAADTIVVRGASILGKPVSRTHGEAMLRLLAGRWHEVVTGLCLLDTETGRARAASTATRVHFRRLTPSEIAWYLDTGEYADKAGAYAIQGYGSLFIDRIEGCYFNVVGFPLFSFERLVRALGIDLLSQLTPVA